MDFEDPLNRFRPGRSPTYEGHQPTSGYNTPRADDSKTMPTGHTGTENGAPPPTSILSITNQPSSQPIPQETIDALLRFLSAHALGHTPIKLRAVTYDGQQIEIELVG